MVNNWSKQNTQTLLAVKQLILTNVIPKSAQAVWCRWVLKKQEYSRTLYILGPHITSDDLEHPIVFLRGSLNFCLWNSNGVALPPCLVCFFSPWNMTALKIKLISKEREIKDNMKGANNPLKVLCCFSSCFNATRKSMCLHLWKGVPLFYWSCEQIYEVSWKGKKLCFWSWHRSYANDRHIYLLARHQTEG